MNGNSISQASAIPEKVKKFFDTSTLSVILLILIGFNIRLYWLLKNPSLWFDEALLAFNIISRPLSNVWGKFYGDQAAPAGFIFLVKCANCFLGFGEIALRIIPFISSIGLLLVLYFLCRKLSGSKTMHFLALYLAVFSAPLIAYSIQLKQYSLEALIAAGMFAGVFYWRGISSFRGYCWLFLAGALGFVFSFSTAMVFPAVVIFLLLNAKAENNSLRFRAIIVVASFWLLFIAGYYGFCISKYIAVDSMRAWWIRAGGFPAHESILADMRWVCHVFADIYSGIISAPIWFGTGLFLIGAISFFRNSVNIFIMFFVPICISIALALLRLYPLTLRLILFMLPVFFIFIAQGFTSILSVTKNIFAKIVMVILFCVIFFDLNPRPYADCNMSRALDFVAKNREKNDAVFTTYYSSYIMFYYSRFYNFTTYRLWPDFKPLVYPKADKLLSAHKRAWVIFAHTDWPGIKECPWFMTRYRKNLQGVYTFGEEKVLFLDFSG